MHALTALHVLAQASSITLIKYHRHQVSPSAATRPLPCAPYEPSSGMPNLLKCVRTMKALVSTMLARVRTMLALEQLSPMRAQATTTPLRFSCASLGLHLPLLPYLCCYTSILHLMTVLALGITAPSLWASLSLRLALASALSLRRSTLPTKSLGILSRRPYAASNEHNTHLETRNGIVKTPVDLALLQVLVVGLAALLPLGFAVMQRREAQLGGNVVLERFLLAHETHPRTELRQKLTPRRCQLHTSATAKSALSAPSTNKSTRKNALLCAPEDMPGERGLWARSTHKRLANPGQISHARSYQRRPIPASEQLPFGAM
jgi:hypothetical protein